MYTNGWLIGEKFEIKSNKSKVNKSRKSSKYIVIIYELYDGKKNIFDTKQVDSVIEAKRECDIVNLIKSDPIIPGWKLYAEYKVL